MHYYIHLQFKYTQGLLGSLWQSHGIRYTCAIKTFSSVNSSGGLISLNVLQNVLFHWVLLCDYVYTYKACYVTHRGACSTRCSGRAWVSLWSLD